MKITDIANGLFHKKQVLRALMTNTGELAKNIKNSYKKFSWL
jgi:hypothetical protein